MESRVESAASPPLPPLDGGIDRRAPGPAPLGFAQRRLWFLDQMVPGLAAYNMPIQLQLDGPLDRAALAASLRELVARHDALRTTFALDPLDRDEPAQT